jgi:hypothetical protein
MESLFSSIMQSAVLEEVAAQKSEPEPSQTEEAPSHKQANSQASDSRRHRRASSSRSRSKPRPTKHGKRSRDSKSPRVKSPRSGRSKRTDSATVKSEEEETKDGANQFIPDYSGYNTMDAELKIIQQELLKREHE